MEGKGKTGRAAGRVGGQHQSRAASLRRARGIGRIAVASCGAAALFFLIGGLFATPLCAQSYPNKPIRFILPYPPGGATDILGRIVGLKLAERLGQPFVPENRPGAGSNIGHDIAAKARPDGYTILLASSSLSISPTLYKKLSSDPVKDFAPISIVSETPLVLVVRPALPVKSLRGLVDYAKANPGKLNYGSSGIGGPSHLATELLQNLTKVKLVHVPYKGAGQAMVAMMGNEIDIVAMAIAATLPQIRAGKVRALAVLGDERSPALPDVPTAKEAGVENFEVTQWYGLAAPAGTPGNIIARLNAEWVAVAAMPDTRDKMQKVELEPTSGTPEQFSRFIQAEIARWGKVIRDANLSAD